MTEDIPYVDVVVNKESPRDGLLKVSAYARPRWKEDDIKIELLQQGFINHMFLCKVNGNETDWLVARIFGVAVDAKIDKRKSELSNSKLMSELGIGPPVYATFRNGLIFGYVMGKTYFWTDFSAFKDGKLLNAVARLIAKLHSKATKQIAIEKYGVSLGSDIGKVVNDLSEMGWPDVIVDEETTQWFLSQVTTEDVRKKELTLILDSIRNLGEERIFCHNDCNPTNVIFDEENDRVTLVDFEMCGLGQPFGDLTMILHLSATGYDPTPDNRHSVELQKEFIRTYLAELKRLDGSSSDVTDKEVERLREITEAYFIAMTFFFHIIAVRLVSPGRPIDPKVLLGTSTTRLKWYWKNRDRMLEILNRYAATSSRTGS
ncbi:ethanolamine kinase 1-like [Lineus longissimus]|uniref:ethanolamine kinase 1-like n=1 Tax=Lineus longissimus TaxID=88925 RepID=UPI002B4E7024